MTERMTQNNGSEQYRINPDRKVQILDHFGFPLIVIDDVYEDPDSLRIAALGLNYERTRFDYPGSDAVLWIPGHELCPMMDEIISSVLKRPVMVDPFRGIGGIVNKAPPNRCFQAVRPPPKPFAVSPGNFNPRDLVSFTALAGNEELKNQPHFDAGIGFALVVYLNPESQCRGGTALYRHVHTDLVARPNKFSPELLKWMRGLGYENRSELLRAMTFLSASNTGEEDWEPEWKLERIIEMRWNRLVCYPTSLLHSLYLKPGDFGNTLDTTRLTMNMFLGLFEKNSENEPSAQQAPIG